jgi:flagellar hook assembly protein FlgD
VFEAENQSPLGINFKLSSNRVARLDVYDLNGVCIAKLAEGPFNAGWNTYHWNGLTEDGRKVGSGVYIIALRSGEFTAWKKCIIVR